MKEKMYSRENYPEFALENTKTGILKVQVSGANQAFPLSDVEVEIWKEINGDKVVFFKGTTDNSGIIDNIILPAKPSKKDVEEASDIIYTSYILTITYPKNNVTKSYEIGIFDDLKVIQPIRISTMSTEMGGIDNV